MLIGDIIIGARALFPDPAQVIPAPAILSLSSAPGSLPGYAWSVQVTIYNQWGESLPSPAQTLSAPANGFSLVMPVLPPGQNYRVYFFPSAITAPPVYVFSLTGGADTVEITDLTGISGGIVPVVPTAYLPDTDGGMIGAALLYAWINEGLNIAAQRCGGFLDIGGAQAVSGQPTYSIDAHWKQLDHAFFDGWPIQLGTRDDIFRHSLVSGVSGRAVAQRVADQIVLELYPQPNRSGANTTLGGAVAVGDTQLTVAAGGLANFLPFGILQITSGSVVETVSYGGISGDTASGLVRGICGTVPQAWSTGATVKEFNIRLEGRRYPETYAVGSSLATLRLPPGMDAVLQKYLLHKYYLAQQDWTTSKDVYALFLQDMDALISSEPVETPTQLRGGLTDEVFGIETGRLIIP